MWGLMFRTGIDWYQAVSVPNSTGRAGIAVSPLRVDTDTGGGIADRRSISAGGGGPLLSLGDVGHPFRVARATSRFQTGGFPSADTAIKLNRGADHGGSDLITASLTKGGMQQADDAMRAAGRTAIAAHGARPAFGTLVTRRGKDRFDVSVTPQAGHSHATAIHGGRIGTRAGLRERARGVVVFSVLGRLRSVATLQGSIEGGVGCRYHERSRSSTTPPEVDDRQVQDSRRVVDQHQQASNHHEQQYQLHLLFAGSHVRSCRNDATDDLRRLNIGAALKRRLSTHLQKRHFESSPARRENSSRAAGPG
jgi:hypothetical protein